MKTFRLWGYASLGSGAIAQNLCQSPVNFALQLYKLGNFLSKIAKIHPCEMCLPDGLMLPTVQKYFYLSVCR